MEASVQQKPKKGRKQYNTVYLCRQKVTQRDLSCLRVLKALPLLLCYYGPTSECGPPFPSDQGPSLPTTVYFRPRGPPSCSSSLLGIGPSGKRGLDPTAKKKEEKEARKVCVWRSSEKKRMREHGKPDRP